MYQCLGRFNFQLAHQEHCLSNAETFDDFLTKNATRCVKVFKGALKAQEAHQMGCRLDVSGLKSSVLKTDLFFFFPVMRVLGIPSRVVTVFNAAHDGDGSLKIEEYYTSTGEKLNLSKDSVWLVSLPLKPQR